MLFGPPTILIYMASTQAPSAIRAILMLYHIITDAAFMTLPDLSGSLDIASVVLGLGLVLPCGAATFAGSAIFRPAAARLYRGRTFVSIAGQQLADCRVLRHVD